MRSRPSILLLVVVPAVALWAWAALVKPVGRMEAPAEASNQENIAGQEIPAECLLAVVDDSHVTGCLSEEGDHLEKDYCRLVVDSNSCCSFVHSHDLQFGPGKISLPVLLYFLPPQEITRYKIVLRRSRLFIIVTLCLNISTYKPNDINKATCSGWGKSCTIGKMYEEKAPQE